MSVLRVAAVVAALFASQAGFAQSRGAAPGTHDFNVLALSWSPGFCAVEGDLKQRDQCRAGSGLGFVVHGLWPQNERGYPTDCGAAERAIPRAAMAVAREIYPSEGLARHQWRKHGTCAGTDPASYFRDVSRARDKVVVPARFSAPMAEASLSPIEVERAFMAANPGLRADMMAVTCRRGMMQEVRICLTRDLRSFRTCPEVDRDGCRTRDMRVAPLR